MVGYSDTLSANMENSRNSLRRIARHEDTEFSKDSILNTMDKFVKSVNKMGETVLVPHLLKDLSINDVPSEPGRRNQNVLAKEDLFILFNTLNNVKTDLLWGRHHTEEKEKDRPAIKKGHVRRPSTASTASTSSSVSLPSDTDSEAGAETSEDSGVDGEDCESGAVGAERIAESFRRHLIGLRQALTGLTEISNALTHRYQSDFGAPV